MATVDAAAAPSLRDRLVPRSVLGLSVLILAFAIGAAFSGVVFYSYYEFRKDTSEDRFAEFVQGFDQRFDTATKTIEAERENAKSEIQKELEPLKQIRAEGDTLNELVKKVGPAVWFVRTLDAAGQPSVGTAFVVASDNSQSLALTSFATVEAATHTPGPQVTVRKGDQELRATLWTWQAERDLALLIIPKGGQAKLDFAPANPPLRIGERLFAVSGLGAGGAAVTQGFVADVSSAGIQHDASVGHAFQGGPLVNSNGQVLGVASRAYAPLGFRTESVWFGVPVRTACDRILRCPSGAVGGAGERSPQTPANPPPP